MQKCFFLDRDGVINKDYVDYVYTRKKFELLPGVVEALRILKSKGYLVILITNQSGIIKGIYTKDDVVDTHAYMQDLVDNLIDDVYFSPYHETFTASLTRKPGSLMFEKAKAKYDIDYSNSWMVGDKPRDIYPAKKLGLNTAIVAHPDIAEADITKESLLDVVKHVVN